MRLETDPAERLLVAVLDGDVGRRGTPAPGADLADPRGRRRARRLPPRALDHRRRGVGKALLEAAADWADEKDSKHIVASVAAAARDSNRFLARLGLGQVAVVRASTVANLRCKLAGTSAPKSVMTNVIAARRLMRRSRPAS